METTLISWNLPNFITIVLMAIVGFLIIGFVCQGVLKMSGNGAGGSASGVQSGF